MNEQQFQGVRLSPLQQRLWSLQNESPVYFQQCVVAIDGPLDEQQLADSVRKVISRHEILRTVYPKQAGLSFPLQAAMEEVSFVWQQQAAKQGFNYQQEQPLIATLNRTGELSWELLLTLPSMAADQLTLQQLAREIAGTYNDSVQEDETLSYTRFSDWQHDLLESPDEFAADFWDKYPWKKGNTSVLPFLHYNTTGGPFRPQWFNMPVEDKLVKQVKAIETTTVSAEHMVMACFSELLRRLAGPDATTMGYACKGREYDELQNTMGLLSRTLPVVIQPVDEPSFTAFAQQIAEELEKVNEYGEYFSWPKDSSGPDYFRAVFESVEIDEIPVSGKVRFTISDIKSITDKSDIKLILTQQGEKFSLGFCFNAAALNELSVQTMSNQLIALLEETVKTPQESMQAIAARSIRQYAFPGDVVATPAPGKNIIELFDHAVQQNKNGIAVQYGKSLLTYAELQEKAGRLSRYLTLQCGVKKGDIVALCMQRSDELIVTMFGILQAGAAYLPVDPKTPVARINYMLEDSQSVLLITGRETKLEDITGRQISMDAATWKEINDVTEAFQPRCCEKCKNKCNKQDDPAKEPQEKSTAIDPCSIAYVIYTSGSTGKPKGVRISHASLVNYVHWFVSKYAITPADRTLLFSSVAFDLCYTSLWSCLLSGATLCIHPEAEYLDPVEFTRDLIGQQITFVKLTPSHFSLVARDPSFTTKFDRYSLRLIVLGGEEIIAEDVETYLRENPDVQFVNHYGPTETTIGVLTKNISKDNIDQFRKKTVLGRPNAGNQVFIIQEQGKRQCAIGETGEICVSGRGLAAGYLNRKELTAEKFIANPLFDETLMYCTGDLGRWMPDGNIEFLGRKDFQVKIRGYRIETGEIEEALLAYPGVEDAVVLVAPLPGSADKQLVAFVKCKEKMKRTALNDHLAGRLPHYMVPSSYTILPAFPLLPNGKLDRNALLELNGQQSATREYVAPRTNTERKLAKIWKEVLSSREAGITDNFFDLGGHSLKAAQLVSRIYKAFDKKIELRSVFDNPTIAQLARVIQNSGYEQYDPIPRVPEAPYYPVSHAQKRLWILNHFTKDKIPYNSSSYYRIKGDLKNEILVSAFETLINRHESLRTSFIAIDGMPWQKINTYEDCGFKLETDDLRQEEDPDSAAFAYSLSGYNTPFDLEKGPLLRARVIRLRDEEYLLVCNIHHIIYDGWSLNILFNELLTIYNAYEEQKENPLPPLTVQYKDYAAWHNSMISAAEEEYWLKQLSNHPRLIRLPYDKIDNPDEIEYSRKDVYLDEEDTQALREIARSCQTTVSNLILSIYGLFLHQVSGQQDIMIGIGHANRNHDDTEKLIGFFINMLAVRIRFSEEDTLETVVRQVSDSAIAAFEHSNYPFDLLVEKLCVNRYADRQPILNVMYDFKNFYDVQLQEDLSLLETNLKVEQVRMGETLAAHDLILQVADNGETIMYYFEYKKDCFLPSTIQNFYTVFRKLAGLVIRELTPVTMAAC